MIKNPTSYAEVKEQYFMFRDMYSMLMQQFYTAILSFNDYKGVVEHNQKVSYASIGDVLIGRTHTVHETHHQCNYAFFIKSAVLLKQRNAFDIMRHSNKLHAHRDYSELSNISGIDATIHMASLGFSSVKENEHLELVKLMLENCFVQQNNYMPSTAVRFPNKLITSFDPHNIIEASIAAGPVPFSGEEILQYLNDETSDAYFNVTLSTTLDEQLKMAMITMPGWTEEVREYMKEHSMKYSSLHELLAIRHCNTCCSYIHSLRDVNKELRLFNEQQKRHGNTSPF